jgi:DNA repair protein RadC
MQNIALRELKVTYSKKIVRLPGNTALPKKVVGAADVYRLYRDLMNEITERFLCLHLSTANELLCFEVIAIGTQRAALVDVKAVFRSALLTTATRLIFVHNHPSGRPEASAEDRALTKRLQAAAALFDIEILDHVIIGDEKRGYFSFAEKGIL